MKRTMGVIVIAVSCLLQNTAFGADVLFKATLDPKDTRQAACIKEVSSVGYSKVVLNPEGKLDLRFVMDQTGKISAEVLSESIFSSGKPVQTYTNVTEVYVRTANTSFEMSPYEGLVRDVVTVAGETDYRYAAISEFQLSVGGVNPQPGQIVPISRTIFAIRGDTVTFSRSSLIKPEDIGIRVPKVVAETTVPLACEFEKVP